MAVNWDEFTPVNGPKAKVDIDWSEFEEVKDPGIIDRIKSALTPSADRAPMPSTADMLNEPWVDSNTVDRVSMPGSVMDGVEESKLRTDQGAVDALGVPLTREYTEAVRRKMDSASPAGREAMVNRPGLLGRAATEIMRQQTTLDDEALKNETIPGQKDAAIRALDTRKEARSAALSRQGMDPEIAAGVAGMDAAQGIGSTVGGVDKSEFDFDAAQRYKDASPIVKGMASGAIDLAKQGVAIHALINEALGRDEMAANGRAKWGQLGLESEAINADSKIDVTQRRNSAGKYIEESLGHAIASVITNAPGLAASFATGGGGVGLLMMGAQVGADEVFNGRKRGLSNEDALARGVIYGWAEAVGEKFGLASFKTYFKEAAKGVKTSDLPKFLASHLDREIPGELLTTNIQYGTDVAAGLEKPSLEGYLKQNVDTVVQTLMQGGLMHGGGKIVQKASQLAGDYKRAVESRGDLTAGMGFNPADIDAAARQSLDPSRAQMEQVGRVAPLPVPRATPADIAAATTHEAAITAIAGIGAGIAQTPISETLDITQAEIDTLLADPLTESAPLAQTPAIPPLAQPWPAAPGLLSGPVVGTPLDDFLAQDATGRWSLSRQINNQAPEFVGALIDELDLRNSQPQGAVNAQAPEAVQSPAPLPQVPQAAPETGAVPNQLTPASPTAARPREESQQEISEREFAENYDRVQQDIPGSSTKDLYRAVIFADKAIQSLNLKAQRGEPYNTALRDSLIGERDYLKGEWEKREDRFEQTATKVDAGGAAIVTPQSDNQQPAARTYLDVPFQSKDLAKRHGAKWDEEKKLWYADKKQDGSIHQSLSQYIPQPDAVVRNKPTIEAAAINKSAETGEKYVAVKHPSIEGGWMVGKAESEQAAQANVDSVDTPPQRVDQPAENEQAAKSITRIKGGKLEIVGFDRDEVADTLKTAKIAATVVGKDGKLLVSVVDRAGNPVKMPIKVQNAINKALLPKDAEPKKARGFTGNLKNDLDILAKGLFTEVKKGGDGERNDAPWGDVSLIAERLRDEHNYMLPHGVDGNELANALRDLIREHSTDTPVLTEQRQTDRMTEAKTKEHRANVLSLADEYGIPVKKGIIPRALTDIENDLAAAIEDEIGVAGRSASSTYDAAISAGIPESELDAIIDRIAVGYTGDTSRDVWVKQYREQANAFQEAIDANQGREGRDTQDEGAGDNLPAPQGSEGRPALELAGQSEAEARADEERIAAAEAKVREDESRAAAVERQARIDAEVASRQDVAAGNFDFTPQVNDKAKQKKADQAEIDRQLAGQGDIFGQPAAPSPITEASPVDPVSAVKATLDAAGITGSERTNTIAQVRRGDLTPADVAEAHPVQGKETPASLTSEAAKERESTNAPYERLLNLKSTKLLTTSGGRKLYSVTPSAEFKAEFFEFGRGWILPRSDSFEFSEKAKVTGNPSDNGYILTDKRGQESREPAATKEPAQGAEKVGDYKIGGYPVSGLGDKALKTVIDKSSNEADKAAASAELERKKVSAGEAAPKPLNPDSAAVQKADDDLDAALGDLGDILGKNFRATFTPEQEQKIIPVLTRLFDAAFRKGYYKFKEAARFVLDAIQSKFGADVADQITIDHLAGAYIGMSGRYRDQGAEKPAAVAAVESKYDLRQDTPGDELPAGWTEAAPGGLATSPDPISGGIIDQEMQTGKWFVIPENDAINKIEGLGSREEAFRALQAAVNAENENGPDQRSSTDLERDSQDAEVADGVGAQGVRAGHDGNGGTGGRGIQAAEGEGGAGRGSSLFGPEAPASGEPGDQSIYTGAGRSEPETSPAGSGVDSGSGSDSLDGSPIEPTTTDLFAELAESRVSLDEAKAKQRAADALEHKPGLANIRETLPILTDGQQQDVHTAETRFTQPDGYGMLFTNGTGTGKTFLGLGVIKRMVVAGKSNIIIAAPNDKIADDWRKSGRLLGLDISLLKDTSDAGRGVVITTYANFGQNPSLASRAWDLVITDEAHYLSMNAKGEATLSQKAVQALTMHPDGAYTRARMLHGDMYRTLNELQQSAKVDRMSDDERNWSTATVTQAKADALAKEISAMEAEIKADVAAHQGEKRPRALFLSATPFAYEKTVDWANGYLFDYNEGRGDENREFRSYNAGSNSDQFMMQHFGYRMRYGKLTEPDAKVDRGLMQRQFNTWLKKRGVLSGRMLDVQADYDRRFILTESAIGTRIDEALEWFETKRKAGDDRAALGNLRDTIAEKFDYLSRRYLLEAIKADAVIPHIREHLAMGRKVVVFHDYKAGGGFNPFNVQPRTQGDEGSSDISEYNDVVDEFRAEFKDLIGSDVWKASSPIATFKREFPGVLLFNGDVPKATRRANVEKFQDDASGPQVILAQSAAGKEGISLHDTTGKHQRVLFNLGQPTAPTTAIQQEGRIYRTGQVTDAIFRYLNTGTDWEKWAFATTIAQRASAAENLGMGEQARALKDAFIAGFEESDDYRAGMENEGKGGKERDKAANAALTEYDRARAFYFGTQKKTTKTKAQEGTDYFATPEPVGLKMMEWADIRPGESVLEPSAGHGAIARWMPDTATKTAIEPSMALRARLAMVFDGTMLDSNFEDLHINNKYDAIVLNPPFGSGGKTAIDHLAKAATHLRDGGRIVALIPRGPAADKKFDKWFYEGSEKASRPIVPASALSIGQEIHKGDTVRIGVFGQNSDLIVDRADKIGDVYYIRTEGADKASGINVVAVEAVIPGSRTETFKPAADLYLVADINLPQVTFERAGTQVATRIVVIEKSPNSPQQFSPSFTDVEDINELFDRLEGLTIGPRAKPIEEVQETDAPKVAKAKKEDARAAAIANEERAKEAGAVVEDASQATFELKGNKIVTNAPTIQYTTKGGKVLTGVLVPDKAMAKAADKFSWATREWGMKSFVRIENIERPGIAFNSLEDDRQAAVSRAIDRAIAMEQGNQVSPLRRVMTRNRLNKLRQNWESGMLTQNEFIAEVEKLHAQMELAAESRRYAPIVGRARGADFLRQKLLEAKRRGDISEQAADMAEWFILKNPALVDDLGIGIRTPKEGQAASGNYNPLTRVMQLFKGSASDTTAVHEILHHLERMMPAEMQAEIRKEWLRAVTSELQTATKAKDQKRIDYFTAVLAGDQKKATELLTGKGMEGFNAVEPAPTFKAVDTESAEFKAWFGASKAVDADGKPMRVYHGTENNFDTFDNRLAGANTRHPTARLGFFTTTSAKVANVFIKAKTDTEAERSAFRASNELAQRLAEAAGYGSVYQMSPHSPERKAIHSAAEGAYAENDFRERASVMPVYLSLQNPLTISWDEWYKAADWISGTSEDGIRELMQKVKDGNHDGIHLPAQPGASREYAGDTYIAFDSAQIKSSISNTGAFSRTDPRITQDLAIGQDYQYLNPSEFWAVRMTSTLAARFEAKSIWARSLQWLKEALQHIKGALGLKSDHPLLKALDDLIAHGNGEFQSKEMLGSSDVYAAPETVAGDSGIGDVTIAVTESPDAKIASILAEEGVVQVNVTGGNADALVEIAETFGKQIVWYRGIAVGGVRSNESSDTASRVQVGSSGDTLDVDGLQDGQDDVAAGPAEATDAATTETGNRAPQENDSAKEARQASPNGFVQVGLPGVLFLNIDGSNHLGFTLGHELGHTMEQDDPALWKKLGKDLTPFVQRFADYRLDQNYTKESGLDTTREFVSDVIGQNFLNPEFWNQMGRELPSVFQKIGAKFIRIINKALGLWQVNTHPYISDMVQARAIVASAMAEYGSRAQKGLYARHASQLNMNYSRQGANTNLRQQAIPITGAAPPPSPTRQTPAPLQGGTPGSQATWQQMDDTKLDDVIRVLQDKHIDTKRAVQAIQAAGRQVADKWDPYLQETLFHGRAAKRTLEFVETELTPLAKDLAMRGLTMDELDEYLHARHAEEANAVIAQRNPAMPDNGSGMTNQASRDYFTNLDPGKQRSLAASAALVDAIIDKTRQTIVAYGLESQETIDAWTDAFDHYVPLMREGKDGNGHMGIGQGFSIKGKESKSRTGSTRKVVDILANIAMQRERAIVRGEKNRVSMSLFGLAKLNPNTDFWTTDKIPVIVGLNPATGLVEAHPDPLYKSRDNVIVAKFPDGKGGVVERAVIFKADNEQAMNAVAAMKNLDVAQLEGLLGSMASITRYFAAVNTQWNPVFGVTNFVRDFQDAALNLSSTPIAGHKAAVLRGTFGALAGIYVDTRNMRKGAPATSPWAQLWEEFQHEGGQTGYRDMFRTSEDRAKQIARAIDPNAWMDSTLGKIFTAGGMLRVPLKVAQAKATWLFDWLSDYNEAMENAVRLSAYKVGRDQGMSKQRAAEMAKSLTVNFNRKGQVTQHAGMLYAFFNASVQGTGRIAQTVFTIQGNDAKTIRLSRAGSMIVGGGILLGSMQALMLAAMGFGDDEPPEFVRERNTIIPWKALTLGAVDTKKYITIPMPLGFAVLPNIGRIATEFAMGGFKHPAKHVIKLLGITADAFNPIGGNGSVLQMVTPTALDPLAAISENKDWTKKPIAKVAYDKTTPGHKLWKDTASTPSKIIAEAINSMSGGTKHVAGSLSPTPDQLDYLFGQVTGGVGREMSKAEQSIMATVRGEDLPPHKIPLAGRFYGDAGAQTSQGTTFYNNINRINEYEAEIKGLRKEGKGADAAQFIRDNPEARLVMRANYSERQVQKLRKEKHDLVEKDGSRERVKALEDRIKREMEKFNEAVKASKERQQKAT